MSDFILTDDNCAPPPGFATGLIPRDWAAQPYGSIPGLPAMALPSFSDQEILDRLADQERHKSSLHHMREDYKIRSLNQSRYPFCWAFSTTKAIMYLRARANEPMEELSGFMLACISSGYQVRGGWCDESLQTAREVGICSLAEWPQDSISRNNWNEVNKAAALKRKVTEWSDIPPGNTRMIASLLLMNIPVMVEHNRWAHSVCGYQLVSWNPFKYRIDNSWTENWGSEQGTAIMDWRIDNAAAPYVSGL